MSTRPSGAEREGKTWAAQGRLSDDHTLRLDSVRPVLREDLYDLPAQTAPPAVVAMDFPFGVPAAFAEYICGGVQPSEMPDVWRRVAAMDKDEFIAARDAFVRVNGEPKRICDAHFPGAFSPLHNVSPNMVPMTYEGIRLLHRWRQSDAGRWYVPPLPLPAGAGSKQVALLEVMPGMLLKEMNPPLRASRTDNIFWSCVPSSATGWRKPPGCVCRTWASFGRTVSLMMTAWTRLLPPLALQCGRGMLSSASLPMGSWTWPGWRGVFLRLARRSSPVTFHRSPMGAAAKWQNPG